MNRWTYCWIVVLGAMSLASSSRPVVQHNKKAAAVAAGEAGSKLPEFSVKDFHGRQISSADLRGKVVIVDFWATWCEPCKREMPGYQRLLNRYGPRGLAVVGFKATMMMDTEDPV